MTDKNPLKDPESPFFKGKGWTHPFVDAAGMQVMIDGLSLVAQMTSISYSKALESDMPDRLAREFALNVQIGMLKSMGLYDVFHESDDG